MNNLIQNYMNIYFFQLFHLLYGSTNLKNSSSLSLNLGSAASIYNTADKGILELYYFYLI